MQNPLWPSIPHSIRLVVAQGTQSHIMLGKLCLAICTSVKQVLQRRECMRITLINDNELSQTGSIREHRHTGKSICNRTGQGVGGVVRTVAELLKLYITLSMCKPLFPSFNSA